MWTNEDKCIIISAGKIDERVPLPCPGERDLVIAADGGLLHCKRLGIRPGLLLGDFDSMDEEGRRLIERLEREEPDRVKRLPAEKDDTDTLAAVKEAMERGYRRILLYGGEGGRLDHTMANLQSLLYAKKRGADAQLVGKGSRTFILSGGESVEFAETAKGYLSLFALGEKAEGLSVKGMKYPLEEAELQYDFPLGVSNEFTGRKACIALRKGELLVICQEYDHPS